MNLKLFRFLIADFRNSLHERIAFFRLQERFPECKLLRPLRIVNPHLLSLGKGVQIRSNCYLHCGGYEWSNGAGHIKIGEESWLAENIIMYGAGGIEIGKRTGVGPGSMLFSSRDDFSKEFAYLPHIVHRFAEIKIGDYVRIFANVIIAPGVTIGEGAVIGAGSVVIKDIPPWTLAVGVPAKVIRERGKDEGLSSKEGKG